MANIVDTMSKDRVKPEEFTAFIEISKGSKMKYELDETGSSRPPPHTRGTTDSSP